jgi:hypothetical protein
MGTNGLTYILAEVAAISATSVSDTMPAKTKVIIYVCIERNENIAIKI